MDLLGVGWGFRTVTVQGRPWFRKVRWSLDSGPIGGGVGI